MTAEADGSGTEGEGWTRAKGRGDGGMSGGRDDEAPCGGEERQAPIEG